jgi:hypothetical protein
VSADFYLLSQCYRGLIDLCLDDLTRRLQQEGLIHSFDFHSLTILLYSVVLLCSRCAKNDLRDLVGNAKAKACLSMVIPLLYSLGAFDAATSRQACQSEKMPVSV